MKELKLKAMAKVNLGLDVVRRREDGYHELRMVMQSVYLYDQIRIGMAKQPGIHVRTNLSYLPTGEENLAYKAAHCLMEEFGIKSGLWIELQKFIPVAAGLAGGSSDAAAVMVGVNRLFGLGLSLEELQERGVKLGADIPYCLLRGTALAEGIGEKLTALPQAPDCWVLLAKPKIHVSTKFVYGNLKVDAIPSHPDIDGQVQAIQNGDFAQMADRMGNVLETVTIPAFPVIQAIKDSMLSYGAVNAMMSGSGPTVFGLFDDREKAKAAYSRLRAGSMARDVYLTRFFHNRVKTSEALEKNREQGLGYHDMSANRNEEFPRMSV